MLQFIKTLFSNDDDDVAIHHSQSDPELLQTWQELVNQYPETVRNELTEARMINEKFNNLISKCPTDEIKKEIDAARCALLSPLLCENDDYLESNKSFLNTLIMNRWFDYLSSIYSSVANIHSDWGMRYLDELSKGYLEADRRRLSDAKIIFWPLSFGNHWYGLTIDQSDLSKIKISCFDGKNYLDQQNQIFFIGQKLVESLHGPGARRVTKKNWIIPKQDNNTDCGVVVCYCAQRFCNKDLDSFKVGTEIKTEFCSYTHFRLNIGKILSNFGMKEFIDGFILQGEKATHSMTIRPENMYPKIIKVITLK